MDSKTAIEATNLSKKYRLGTIGMTSLREDLSRLLNSQKSEESLEIARSSKNDPISVNQNEFWALNNLSFSIEKGEVIGLIGANGSGKSTLLKILSRITEPTKGSVKVRGRVASLLEVGTGFHPELTGRENIYVNGAIHGMTRREMNRKFDEIVDFAGIDNFIDTPIKRYSSGMTVRLGFAVAAHLDPDILIVDEVLAVGDADFQKKCIGRMGEVAHQGRTVLFVSHNMVSIELLCTKGIFLKKGTIKNFGVTTKIISEYLQDVETIPRKDITQRKDRKGSGEIRLERVKTLNSKMEEVPHLKTGHKGFIQFEFKQYLNFIEELDFSVGINNSKGQRIALISTAFCGITLKLINRKFITIHISKLNLLPGNYYLTTFLGKNEIPCDWVINAYSLVVISGDYYGFGQLPPESQGDILIDYKISNSSKSAIF